MKSAVDVQVSYKSEKICGKIFSCLQSQGETNTTKTDENDKVLMILFWKHITFLQMVAIKAIYINFTANL